MEGSARGRLDMRGPMGYFCAPYACGVMQDEKNISTEHEAAEKETRISLADEDPSGSRHPQGSPSAGPQVSFRLSPSTLPKTARLLRRAEFQKAYRTGRRFVGRFVVVFVVRTDGAVRLGITASKKIGSAVVRNRCKRRIRELFRRHRGRIGEGADVVVNVRPGCGEAPWSELEDDFLTCLDRSLGNAGRPNDRR
jgi:ribonuclease P protein component